MGHLEKFKVPVWDRDVPPVLRRLPENGVPDWAGFWFVFKAWQPAPSGLCKGCRNTEDGRKDHQDGILH